MDLGEPFDFGKSTRWSSTGVLSRFLCSIMLGGYVYSLIALKGWHASGVFSFCLVVEERRELS